MNTQNLTDALNILGIRHEPAGIAGKRNWFGPDGEPLGSYDAHEGWAKLKELRTAANTVSIMENGIQLDVALADANRLVEAGFIYDCEEGYYSLDNDFLDANGGDNEQAFAFIQKFLTGGAA
ncbi:MULTISPECIES: hypothetical protein [unclassified Phyllobacterium]|uniref:hypothetical protein n=1 Tax=unclassified Phyllobacterium TaxID=2638441 RepID=UPI003012B7EA